MESNVNLSRLRAPSQGGFTLIELMAVVVVIAILAVIAYPSFQTQVRKARRAEAVAATSQIQQAQERWRANQPQYAATLMTANPLDCDTAAERVTNSCLGIAAAAGARYTYALSATSGTGYILTATAVSGSSQASDSGCQVLAVRLQTGTETRAAAATAGALDWANPDPQRCWSN